MLKIQLQEASKRFQYEWIFKNLSLQLKSGESLAITGGNGSGKSTLLKCLSGVIPITSGKINWDSQNGLIPESEWYQHLSISAPYLELPEEFSLRELIQFHFNFKKPLNGITPDELIEILYLDQHSSKPISQFSSGMKQRLKLGLAIFSDVPLVLLDEPTSNLDKKGIIWYADLIQKFQYNRILIVCSNEPREYEFCLHKLALEDFK
ncbi:ABC transporter ATP-binding protein [Algoriphagus lacus]|mgnify:CR=1 FL=1|uniref:ABC transporter ATP-binding protein n=1 Tax=Algoriphagus lacus TaxID=2056311 RepID=A0A418PLA6_9BACT|nr:ABC transporter ATP-binding protein [Algoriphagus lacus]RIW12040.1 ABC transporter ATP-binding protein [Algoriphagus lacus]